MKRRFFSTIAAVSALFFVAGFLGCSDDDKSYPSCSEIPGIMEECDKLGDAEEAKCDAAFDVDEDAQKYTACLTAAYAAPVQCYIDDICVGNTQEACEENFKDCEAW